MRARYGTGRPEFYSSDLPRTFNYFSCNNFYPTFLLRFHYKSYVILHLKLFHCTKREILIYNFFVLHRKYLIVSISNRIFYS